jgi:hypothetical protein
VTRAFVERVCTDGESQSSVVHSKQQSESWAIACACTQVGSRCMCDCMRVHPSWFSTYAHGWCACLLESSAETRWHTLDPSLNASATLVTGSVHSFSKNTKQGCECYSASIAGQRERQRQRDAPHAASNLVHRIHGGTECSVVVSLCEESVGWEEMMTRR